MKKETCIRICICNAEAFPNSLIEFFGFGCRVRESLLNDSQKRERLC